MVSKGNEKNKIVLLSKGNTNLKCNGVDESTHILRHGLLVDEQYQINQNLKIVSSQKSWSDDFHSFKLSWSPGNLVLKIDEQSHVFNSPQTLQGLFNSEVKYLVTLYELVILILIYNYLELFIYWCVSRWYEIFS